MALRFNAYIFDLDGTLLDTMGDFVAVTNATLSQLGHRTYTREEILSFFSAGGMRALLRKALPPHISDAEVEDAFYLWNDIFLKQGLARTTLYPQVKETLLALKNGGAKLAVLSNKRDDHTHHTIEHFLPDIFDAIHGECEGFPRKPDPTGLLRTMEELQVTAGETAYIGDSAGDVLVAQNVNAFAVAVDYGYGTSGSISETNANATISQFAQLLSL